MNDQVHKTIFWIDSSFYFEESWLKNYICDCNKLLESTNRRLIYDGFSDKKYDIIPIYDEKNVDWFTPNKEFHIIILPTTEQVPYSGQAWSTHDGLGNTVCYIRFKKFYKPFDPDGNINSEYNDRQIKSIVHEFCHGYGAGDLYYAFSGKDPSGIYPSADLFGNFMWNIHPDWKTDIMASGFKFSKLTSEILNNNWRKRFPGEVPNLGVPVCDINNIKLYIKDISGNILDNVRIRIWKNISTSPVCYFDKTGNGDIIWSWGSLDYANAFSDLLRFITIEANGQIKKEWICYFDLQEESVLHKKSIYEHTIIMENTSTQNNTEINIPQISIIPNQISNIPGKIIGPIMFTVNSKRVSPSYLGLSITSSNPLLLPNDNIGLNGTGSSRSLLLRPVSGVSGTSVIKIIVSDGTFSNSTTFDIIVGSVGSINPSSPISSSYILPTIPDSQTQKLDLILKELREIKSMLIKS